MTLKNFLYQNCNISYRIYGQGKPLMLLHGFGENSSIWQKQADALKNNYLIITPDLPGSGKSAFWQKENVQMQDYADILNAILQQEKIEYFFAMPAPAKFQGCCNSNSFGIANTFHFLKIMD